MGTRIKLVLALTYIICTWQAALGQENVIKGRAFVLPIFPMPYSLGIGYERIISQHVAVQVLLNNYGSDGRNTDADAEFFTAIVPETKYYFNAEKKMSSFYSAFFIELLRGKLIPSGESYDSPEITRKQISPGLLVGKNIKLNQKWHFELYTGVKYRFGWKEEDYPPSVSQDTFSQYRKWGIRTGINLAVSF